MMLVVYSPGGCIKIRLAKVFKMAAIQDCRQNFELYSIELSDKHTYLG